MSDPKMETRHSRVARHARILDLIATETIGSQGELADLLEADGIKVSQGTLSKDLLEIGAVRVRNRAGTLVYAAPDDQIASDHATHEAKLARVCAEVLISATPSGNLVVLKTPPGAAQYMASLIDKVANPDIVGSIAGDDTVMVIAATPDGGADLAHWFSSLAA